MCLSLKNRKMTSCHNCFYLLTARLPEHLLEKWKWSVAMIVVIFWLQGYHPASLNNEKTSCYHFLTIEYYVTPHLLKKWNDGWFQQWYCLLTLRLPPHCVHPWKAEKCQLPSLSLSLSLSLLCPSLKNTWRPIAIIVIVLWSCCCHPVMYVFQKQKEDLLPSLSSSIDNEVAILLCSSLKNGEIDLFPSLLLSIPYPNLATNDSHPNILQGCHENVFIHKKWKKDLFQSLLSLAFSYQIVAMYHFLNPRLTLFCSTTRLWPHCLIGGSQKR